MQFLDILCMNMCSAFVIIMGSLRLDTNQLNTSHSQRLNSGKPLGTGRVIGRVQLIHVQTSPSHYNVCNSVK